MRTQLTLFEIPRTASRPRRRTRGCPLCDGLDEFAQHQAKGLRLVLRELQALRAEVAKLRHKETLRPRMPTSPAPAQNVVELFDLIERSGVVFSDSRPIWTGPAAALQSLLLSPASRLTIDDRRVFMGSPNAVGQVLAKCMRSDEAGRLTYNRVSNGRRWTVRRLGVTAMTGR